MPFYVLLKDGAFYGESTEMESEDAKTLIEIINESHCKLKLKEISERQHHRIVRAIENNSKKYLQVEFSPLEKTDSEGGTRGWSREDMRAYKRKWYKRNKERLAAST